MKLTQTIFQQEGPIWESFCQHPFVCGIGTGELDQQIFCHYMIQDYLYLLDYAKVFALGVVKAQDEETMRFYANLVRDTLDGEMHVHKGYMERLGITPGQVSQAKPTLENLAYTHYMLWVANNEGILPLTIAVLACSWSYAVIAPLLIQQHPGAQDHPFYGEWVRSYASPAYQESNQQILDLVDRLGANCSSQETAHLLEICHNCTEFERLFWDMAQRGR